MRTIKSQSRQSSFTLVMAWMFIILIPGMTLTVALDLFFEKRFEQNLTRIKPLLQTELRVFMQDFDERIWLQKRFREFDQKAGFVTGNQEPGVVSSEAQDIRLQLQKHLKFQVLAVFSHGADTNTVSFDINNEIEHELTRPTGFFLRKLMSMLSEQHNFGLLFPEVFKPAFSAQHLAEIDKTRRVYLKSFLRNFFSTILEVDVKPGVVIPTISSKCGDTGKIFFYYGVARTLRGDERANLAGYFAVVRARDIPDKILVKDVCSNPFNEGLRRSIGVVESKLALPDDFKDHDLSGYRVYNDRVALQAMIPESLILRLVQKGGIVSANFGPFLGKTPCLEVSSSREALEHPLHRYFGLFKFLIKLISLAGTILFLRLLIFGYGASISVAIKIAFAVIFACFLPSVGLMIAAVAHYDYEKNSEESSVVQELKGRVAFCKNLVNQKMELYAEQNQALAAKFEESPDQEHEKDIEILRLWAEKRPVAGYLFKKFASPTIEWWSDDYRNQPQFKGERDSKWFMFHSSLEYLMSSPLLTDDFSTLSNVITEGTKNHQSIGAFITSNGKLLYPPNMAVETRFSVVVPTRKKGKTTVPMGLLLIFYHAPKLADSILEQLQEEFQVSEVAGQNLFDLAVIKLSGNSYDFHDSLLSEAVDKEIASRLIGYARPLKSDVIYNFKRKGFDHTCVVNIDEKLAMGFIVFVRRRQAGVFSGQWLLPALYVLLLVALSLALSRQMFIAPLLIFIKGLEEVAGGNLQHKMAIETGDEFEMMAVECNQMTKELAEKAMLERYVSREILDEIQQTTESQLKPGGERVDASIVFATLGHIAMGGTGQTYSQLEFIGQFYEICHSICTSNGGMIDKVIGATLMMVFRADESGKNHKNRACQAVFQIKNALTDLSQQHSLRFAAGINSGSVISGKIGSHTGKLDYTVIGDAVNLAARLKAHAAMFDEATIICSGSVATLTSELFQIKPEAEIRIKGKADRIRIYRLTEF